MLNQIKIQSQTNKKYFKNNIYPQIPFDDTDIYIITKAGDRLDILAKQYYNDKNYWKYISSINNNITKGSLYPEPGTQLRIPQDINKILKIYNNAN